MVTKDDFPTVAGMYEKMNNYLRRFNFTLPEVENAGGKWLNTYRRTLGRFSIIYVAEILTPEKHASETPLSSEIVGFISARLKQVPPHMGGVMVGEMMEIWIEPRVRRLGIGDKLVHMTLAWLKEKDAQSVEVQILVDNVPSINLVKSMGMKPELYQLRLNWEDYLAPEESIQPA
jgi:ribosomal protein S18 acetylase RimI-like enzyme